MSELREMRIEPEPATLAAARAWLAPLRVALGDGFRAAYLTGSVLLEGFDAERSRVNILVIARTLDSGTLLALAKSFSEPKKGPRFDPLFLAEPQIEKSLDSFPIEWSDIQERHLLLEGEHVLGAYAVPNTHLRLQCEHELRSKQIRLRQTFLARHAHPKDLEQTLGASASGFATLFRTLLRLKGETPPASSSHVVERVADLFGLDAKALLIPHLVRHGRAPQGDTSGGYLRFLAELDRLIGGIDALKI
jgi:hypothetical protein